MEPNDKPLPCQQALLAAREDIDGWRVYRCESTKLACMISGAEPDAEMLALACEDLRCKQPPP